MLKSTLFKKSQEVKKNCLGFDGNVFIFKHTERTWMLLKVNNCSLPAFYFIHFTEPNYLWNGWEMILSFVTFIMYLTIFIQL